MPYQANIPQPADQLTVSQGDLLNNFQAINTWVNVNHEAFNGANQGKHTWVAFTGQVGATPFVLGEVGLSNYLLGLTNTRELWISLFNSAGTKFEYPISASTLSTVPTPAFGSTGFFYLPSGMFVKYGRMTGAVAGANTVNLDQTAAGGPRFTTIMNVMLTPISGVAPFVVTFTGSNLVPNPQVITVNIGGTGTLPTAFMYYIVGA